MCNDNDVKIEFGNNLKFLLNEKEMNKAELARNLNVAYSQVSYWCNSTYLPNFENVINISNYFKTSLDFLCGFSDEKYFFPLYEINFFQTLNSIINERKVKYVKIYKKCNLANNVFYSWERGSLPHLQNLADLSKYFELPIEYIIGRTDKTSI